MTRPAAIVTGGLRGIGRACAEALADAGFDLVGADLPPDAGGLGDAMALRGARLAYARFDLGDLSTHAGVVDAALQTFGRVDCLVNNAGMGAVVRGDMLDLTPDNFDRVMGVNLRGTAFLSQAVAKAMLGVQAASPRSIITVTSVSAEMASPERAEYCVSKAALSMWVKNLALRLAAENIGVFEVRPGIIRTDMTAGVSEKYDRLIEGGLVPAKRWGEGTDVARVVAALAGGQFGFATGSIVNADGGLSVPRL
jgi:NAD(P)-dependent dehydrogenase (short-subunit alcohol dehydrogenase family)